MITSMIPNVENVFKNHQITNLTFLSVYKPYINYSWSQTLTVGGNQQIKDIGTAGLNLQQFFGQGCWFNGVDNYLNNVCQTGIRNNTGSFMVSVSNITSNPNLKVFGGINTHRTWIGHRNGYLLVGIGDVSSVIACPLESVMQVVLNYDNFNYEVYVNNQLKKSGTYTVAITENRPIEIGGLSSSFYVSAVIKDVYMFNRPLTPTEIEKYTNNHNQFFMDSLEDNGCILAMPMCEKDKYVRNYKNYSEIPQTIAYTTLNGWVGNEDFTYSVNKDTGWFYLYRNTNLTNGLYYVSFEVTSITSGKVQFDNEIDANISASTPGLFNRIIEVKSNKLKFTTGGTGAIGTVRNLEVKELTSIYPITNYLTTCRTNAQRLPYGLQTSGFKRDTKGLILGKSNSLECDGVGIATRIGHSETVKIKTTVNPSLLSGTVLSGGISLSTTGMIINQDNIITLENQNPTTVVTFGNGFSGTIKEYKEEK